MTNTFIANLTLPRYRMQIWIDAGYSQEVRITGPGYDKTFGHAGKRQLADEELDTGTYTVRHYFYHYNDTTRRDGRLIVGEHSKDYEVIVASFEDDGAGTGWDCSVQFSVP